MTQDIFLFRLKSGINVESLWHVTHARRCVLLAQKYKPDAGAVSCPQADIGRKHEQHVYVYASDPSSDIQGMREGSQGR